MKRKYKKGEMNCTDTLKYNKKGLYIDKYNTLIIIDWDNTLYPTSWVMDNGIDLTDPRSRYKYMEYFKELDKNLEMLLKHMNTLGEVVIITNAMLEWVELSVSVLPKTKKYLSNIDIISARKRFQNSADMTEWKKLTFMEELTKKVKKHKIQNIISIGDAEYEYHALINLYKMDALPHKYLKSISFVRSPDFWTLIYQIKMMRQHISAICRTKRQIDLEFDTR